MPRNLKVFISFLREATVHWLLPSCCSSLAAHSLPISSSSFSSPSFFQCTPLVAPPSKGGGAFRCVSPYQICWRCITDDARSLAPRPKRTSSRSCWFFLPLLHFFHRQHAEMRNLFPLASSEPSSSSPLQCRGLGGERVKTSRSRLN